MTKATSMPAFPAVRTLADVEAIERTPLAERLDAESTCGRSHSQPPVKPARRRPATTGGERRMRFQSKPLR